MDHVLTGLDFFERFGFAVLLGTLIGLEREWRQRSAGVHTLALVCGGTSLFVMITPLIVAPSVGDPSRIIGQVVTGIGFLAGGVILRQGSDISGLNTAATLWATAAVGGLTAFGFYPQAIAGAVAITLVNFLSPYISQYMAAHSRLVRDVNAQYKLEITCEKDAADKVQSEILAAVSASRLRLDRISSEHVDPDHVKIVVKLMLMGRDNDQVINEFSTRLKGVAGIDAMHWDTGAMLD
jgi:putative Mg2+ transporter-C (MgtC) family protein